MCLSPVWSSAPSPNRSTILAPTFRRRKTPSRPRSPRLHPGKWVVPYDPGLGRGVAGANHCHGLSLSSSPELASSIQQRDHVGQQRLRPRAGLLLLYDRAGAGAEPLLADVVALLDGTSQFGATAQAQPVTVVRTSNSSAKSRVVRDDPFTRVEPWGPGPAWRLSTPECWRSDRGAVWCRRRRPNRRQAHPALGRSGRTRPHDGGQQPDAEHGAGQAPQTTGQPPGHHRGVPLRLRVDLLEDQAVEESGDARTLASCRGSPRCHGLPQLGTGSRVEVPVVQPVAAIVNSTGAEGRNEGVAEEVPGDLLIHMPIARQAQVY